MKRLVQVVLVTGLLMPLFVAALAEPAHAAEGGSYRYRLVWTDDPTATMTIGWCQETGAPVGVDYGTDPSLATHSSETTLVTSSYDNTASTTGGSAFDNHFVTLRNLTPDTAYYFRIQDSEGYSETMWFKTAPDTPSDFTFIAGGDSRTNAEPRQWGNDLVSRIRPLFILFGADYMGSGTNDEWRTWLDDWQATISADGRMYPIVAQHGNHENDMRDMMQRIFNIGNVDAYYTLALGGGQLRMWILNSELEPGVGYGEFTGQDSTVWDAQAAWLKAELADAANYATWQVASYHRPMRPHTAAKDEGTGRIAAWAQTFYDHGVDLVVESDTHMTKYTYPLAASAEAGQFQDFVRDDENGTTFIGEGSWGAPTRPTDDDKPWTLASESFWQFKLIHVHHSTEDRMDIHTVRFGSLKEFETGIEYDPTTVTPLTQAEQDADAFAMAAGLDLWSPLSGTALSIFPNDAVDGPAFRGADIENVEYVGPGATWKYLDDGSDQGTAWRDAAYDDSAWLSGPAQLGYGDGGWGDEVADEVTVVSYGPDADSKYTTTYFRTSFSVADASTVIKLKLGLLRDDGAVVYINGTEAARSNMPDGPISYATYSRSGIGGAAESTFYEMHLDPAVLVSGDNTLAVEVHQSDPGSSDLSFDAVLYGIESTADGAAAAAPTDFAGVAASESVIDLSWSDSADEAGYELWRQTEAGTWEIYHSRLAPDTTTFTDTLLAEGTPYTYRVRAYNRYGLSAFSETITVATQIVAVPTVWAEDFDDATLGAMSSVNVSSNADWDGADGFASMNGYGADTASDDWLISPPLNLYMLQDESIAADLAYNYDGPELQMLFSANYDPAIHADPSAAIWWDLRPAMPSTSGYAFETTGRLPFYIASEDFESETFGTFAAYDRSSSAEWTMRTVADQLGVVISGYNADAASEDWLIWQAVNLPAGSNAVLTFDLYRNYSGPPLQVMVSADYAGSGDPMDASWVSYPIGHEDAVWDAWETRTVDLSAHAGDAVTIAFLYTSVGTANGEGAYLGVDNVSLEPDTAVNVAFRYASTGTGGGDGRAWQVDNIILRGNPATILNEAFEGESLADSSFTAVSVAGNYDWALEERAEQTGAIMNSYGADAACDDWLISPAIALAQGDNAALIFELYRKYDGPELQVEVSTDYSGAGDPTAATWTSTSIPHGDIDDAWKSVTVDLAQYSGTVYVAFHYTSTGTGGGDGARLGVDNITVVRGYRAILFGEDFESGSVADSSFTAVSVASNYDWEIETRAEQTGAFMNSYGADAACDDWLISPAINLAEGDNAELLFDLYRKYDGPELQVMISTDYSGTGDPTAATWTSTSIPHGDIDDAWKTVTLDLAQYSGPIYIAFHYTSTGTGGGDGARLGVDNINVVRGI